MELEKPRKINTDYIIGTEMQKLPKADRLLRKFHSEEDHKFHIKRYGHCLYCEAGSKPIHSSLLKLSDVEIEKRLAKRKK